MNILDVDSISKNFGDFQAVKELSFSIEEGKVFGLLGPNGAGKTTTIRMIMNIIIPDSGKISIMKHSNAEKANNLIGYLPEERGIYRKMKVNEVLLFLARLKLLPHQTAQNEIDHWLERLDLTEWKYKKVEELSKGMQQKIQIISTILHKPKILIFDEPFMGLDPLNTKLIKEILLELKKNGTTIIFSTHLMDNVEKLCEQIIMINKGKNVLSGNLKTIKNNYGKNRIQLKFSGDDRFLQNSAVKNFDNFGNYVELQLNKEIDPQDFLKEICSQVQISKFEIIEPSLNDIFIEIAEKN